MPHKFYDARRDTRPDLAGPSYRGDYNPRQKSSGYNQRSRRSREDRLGPKLKVRTLVNQRTEAAIGISILNRMTRLSRAGFERVA